MKEEIKGCKVYLENAVSKSGNEYQRLVVTLTNPLDKSEVELMQEFVKPEQKGLLTIIQMLNNK